MVDVAHNLAVLRERIGHAAVRSGRPPDAIRLTLVTKTVGADRVREAILAGQHELGENKVQEGRRKSEELADMPVRWSMIGHLQTNKVKDVLRFASAVQSLDRLSLAQALEQRLQVLGRRIDEIGRASCRGRVGQ